MNTSPSADGRDRPDNRPHVLCINNDQAVLGLYRDLLDGEGDGPYRVSLRAYVDHDLGTLKALEPALIVLDYMWAEEDAGWTLLQMLRMDPGTAPVPIVLCTGAVREVEALQGHLADMGVSVVLKPFNIDRLEEASAAALAAKPASSGQSGRTRVMGEPWWAGRDGSAAERERAKLVHDLRNPLATAIGRVQMMRRRLRRGEADPARLAVDLEAVEAALVRLKALADRLDGGV